MKKMPTISPYLMPAIALFPKLSLTEEDLPVIIKVVERVTGVQVKQLVKQTRKPEVVLARHLYVATAQRNTNCCDHVIAEYIKRDRTTARNSKKVIKDMLDTDKQIKEHYRQIQEMLYLLYK